MFEMSIRWTRDNYTVYLILGPYYITLEEYFKMVKFAMPPEWRIGE
jgi:hypothetical protein